MLLQGIFPPITTPFYPDGKVYFKKIEANVDRYSKTPVAGIVALGSTGEAIMLSSQEQRDVLKSARTVTAPEKVLIAGTGTESAVETLNLTEYAAELGYDVALVRTPFYYKKQMQPANMLAFYRTVADRSPLPILIYSVPPFTGYDMPVELIVALADHPNIIGIKESSGNVDKVREMVEKTRHIKRKATVTETFAAVTQRMVKEAEVQEKCRWGTGYDRWRQARAIFCRSQRNRQIKDAAKRSWISSPRGFSPNTRAISAGRCGWRSPCFCRSRSDRLL